MIVIFVVLCHKLIFKEWVKKLQQLTENALTNFKDINTAYPRQIFVYRNDVSFGELQQVSFKELNAMKQAARKFAIDDPYPDFQFMVVQKRVNARFFEFINHNGHGHRSLIVLYNLVI